VASVLASVTITIHAGVFPSLTAYKTIFAIAGAMALTALVITLFIPTARRRAPVVARDEAVTAAA
jgi:hypothetical protein